MKIEISGTSEELSQFLMLSTLDKKFEMLIKQNAVSKKEKLDDPRFEELYSRISWETVFLWDTIYAKGHRIQDQPWAVYLTSDELQREKIDERSASARVGGAKKVTQQLGMEDILSVKWREGEKRYFISDSSIAPMLQVIELDMNNYKEYLKEENLNLPERK